MTTEKHTLLSFLEMLRRQTLLGRSMRLTDYTVLRKIRLLIWELNMDFKSIQWSHTFEYFGAGLNFLKKSLRCWTTTFRKNKIFITFFIAIKGNSHNQEKKKKKQGDLEGPVIGYTSLFPVTKYHFAIYSRYLGWPQLLLSLTLWYLKDKQKIRRMVFAPPVLASHLSLKIKKKWSWDCLKRRDKRKGCK